MTITPRLRPSHPGHRHSRRAAPRCRGGASSVLRLAHPSAPGLPSRVDIGEWAQRAARALRLPSLSLPVGVFAPSEFTAG